MQALAEIGSHCIRIPVLRQGPQQGKLCRSKVHCKRWIRSASFASRANSKECHYDVLSVNKNATQSEIKAAFLKKTKETHPDMNPGDPSMHARFVRLNEAYSVLGKHTTRREYDFSLAAQLAYRQNIRQHAAEMARTAGSGTYTNSEAEKPFWDETIFEMRDKSQDYNRFYEDHSYYGMQGVHKLPNTYIVFGCFVVMGLGVLLHLGAIQYSKGVSQQYMDDRDKKAYAHLDMVRKRAKENGNAKQLELLKASLEAEQSKQLGPPTDS